MEFEMSQPVITGMAVPASMLAIALICKLIVHQGRLSRHDFALGIDASLAAITSGLIHLCDLYFAYQRAGKIEDANLRDHDRSQIVEATAQAGIYFLVLIGALLFVLLLHQKWQAPANRRPKPQELASFKRWHFCMVLILGNGLGFGSLVVILLVLRSCTCL